MSTRQRVLELFIQVVIVYSIATHFLEVEHPDIDRGTDFFLWSERVIAAIFTVEYVVRWIASRSLWYPFRSMAIVDLLAIAPFYTTFLVDLRSLRLIRLLRVVRLFKLSRHTHALQNLVNAFNRIRYEFAVVGFAAVVVVWCSALAIHELERERQPETFGKLSDSLWYVLGTVTTGGAGDRAPSTTGGRVVAGCTMVAGLALFGTFISLIGGAFLEEIRHSVPHPAAAAGPGPEPEGAAADRLRSMTPLTFNPRQVLRAIDDCTLHGPRGLAHLETVRLLSLACGILIDGGMRPESGPDKRGS